MTLAPRSLQGRLLGLIVGLVVSVWAVTVVVTSLDARHELDELLDGHLAQAAALLVVQQASDGDEDDVVDAPLLHRYAPKVAFQVFHDGQLTLRSATAPVTPMSGIDPGFESGFRTVQIDKMDWRVFAARGAHRDVQVYVGEQLASRDAILWAVLRSTLWPMAAACCAARCGRWPPRCHCLRWRSAGRCIGVSHRSSAWGTRWPNVSPRH